MTDIAVFQQFVGQKYEGLDQSLTASGLQIAGHKWAYGLILYCRYNELLVVTESIVVTLDKTSGPGGQFDSLTVLDVKRPCQEEIDSLKR